MYRYRLAILLLILLAPCRALPAATEPSSSSLPTDAESISPPNPQQLNARWWEYFNTEGGTLTRRIQLFEQQLDAAILTLPASELAMAKPLVGRTKNNLSALQQLKQKPMPEPYIVQQPQLSYTIEQLLDLFRNSRTAQSHLEEEEQDVRQMTRTITSAEKNRDNLLARYLEMSSDDPEKLISGLQLIADQSSVTLAQEQLKVRNERLVFAHEQVSNLQNLLSTAQQRLIISSSTEIQEEQLNKAEHRLERYQDELQRTSNKMLELFPDTPEGRALTQSTAQEVTLASVREALARANLINVEIINTLTILNNRPDDTTINGLIARMNDWSTTLTQLKRRADEWQKNSDREFKRASEDLIDLAQKSDPESRALAKMHQARKDSALQTLTEIQRLRNQIADAEFLSSQIEEWHQEHLPRVNQWIQSGSESLKGVGGIISSWLSISLFKVGGVPVTPAGLLRAIAIFVFAWLLSRFVRLALQRMAAQQWRIAKSTFYTLGRLAHYVLLSLGLAIALASLGLDFSSLALVAGALSVGIGFGLQSIVNNFLSGLIILFEKNLKIGDFLELESGYSGYISEINVRTTILRTNDGIEVVIPNAEIIGNKVVNWTMSDAFRRVKVPFSVAYGTDKDLVKRAALEAASTVPHTLRGIVKYHEPEIQLTGFGDTGLNFDLCVWVDARASKHVGGAKADYLWAIDTAFNKYGIVVPFPTQDIHVKSLPENPYSLETIREKPDKS